MLRVYYPLRQYWAERVSHLEFPFWYPYDGLGQPFLGMVISGALHPTNLLYLALPISWAIKVNVLVCFPAAFAGVYCLLRRFGLSPAASSLGGLLFAFNGYMVTISGNLLYLMAAASFPWAFWGADRFFTRPSTANALTGAVLLAAVLFCGDAQSFAICGAALGVETNAGSPPLGRLSAKDGRSVIVERSLLIGRKPEEAPEVASGELVPFAVPLSERGVSRVHAEIQVDRWNVLLVDRNSANGTFVKPPGVDEWIRLEPGHAVQIVHGTAVAVGPYELTFEPV